MVRGIYFLLFLLFSTLLNAQIDHTFIKHYGTPASEYGTSLTVNADNSIVMVQTIEENSDYGTAITKTDANGLIIWSTPLKVREMTIPRQIEKLANSYLVYGTTWNIGDTKFYLFLASISQSGSINWVKQYSVSASDQAAGFAIYGNKIFLAATADYNIGSVYTKTLILRTDLSGNVDQSKLFQTTYQFNCFSVAVSNTGKLAIASITNGSGIGSPSFQNIVAMQMDTSLQLEWSTVVGTQYDDELNALAYDNTNVVITGRSVFINTDWDLSIFRFDQSGTLTSSAFYDTGNKSECGRSLLVENNGDLVIGGDAGTFDERNMVVLKLNTANDIIWSKEYPVNNLFTNYLFDIEKLNGDSGFVFTGDLRPTTAFRNAPIFRADRAGDIKCFTNTISFSRNNSIVESIPAVILPSNVSVIEDAAVYTHLTASVDPTIVCDIFRVDFSYQQQSNCPEICLNFTDQSINSQLWYWEFPGGTPAFYSGQTPPLVCFDSVKTTTVRLLGWDGVDTLSVSKTLSFENACDTFFIPNVITPNNDGFNDRFVIKKLPDQFQLKIFNRWGNEIFTTSSKNFIWPDQNEKLSSGVYYYTFNSPGKTLNGTISVTTD